jgi:UDP-N-acetylglucosamine 4,6-dehydratase/5-epimerase
LHEVLVSEDEARNTAEMDDMFVVMPAERVWTEQFGWDWQTVGKSLPDGYRYASNNNPQWLSVDQIREMIKPIETSYERGMLD